MDDKTDEEIIRSVRNGNVQEFRHIIGRHSTFTYRTAFAVCRNHEDAQEIIQDAFTKAFISLDSFQGKSKFSTWLFRIVYFTAINHLEKNHSYKRHIDLYDVTGSGFDIAFDPGWDRLIRNDRIKYVGQALNQLGPEDRLALSLFYLEEKSQKEIAAITGWNLSATKLRIHRARLKLSQGLEKILENEKESLS
jgi:RNA polymerase sigma factor (sigma-70 family)